MANWDHITREAAFAIKVECLQPSNISDASQAALSLARKLGATIKFDFNGTECRAWPTDTSGGEIEDRWRRDREHDQKAKEASCHE